MPNCPRTITPTAPLSYAYETEVVSLEINGEHAVGVCVGVVVGLRVGASNGTCVGAAVGKM